MKHSLRCFQLIILALLFFNANSLVASTGNESVGKTPALRVYFDCWRCDMDYIRSALPQIDYVRDRQEAQVQILVTTQQNGSGGREWTFTFLGRENFTGLNDTLILNTGQNSSDDEIRKSTVRLIKQGLVRYLARTPWRDNLAISFKTQQPIQTTPKIDPWNYWVFQIRFSNSYSGEQSEQDLSLYGEISADRITDNWKMEFSAYSDYDEENYTYDTTRYSDYSRRKGFNSLIVKSISPHWSTGLNTQLWSSTYSNMKASYEFTPAVEYNIYPYSASTRREFRMLYRFGVVHNNYYHQTIYNRRSETRFRQRLRAEVEITQPWGSIESSIEGSHYLYNFNRNRLEMRGELSLKVFQGLSVDLYGRFSMIHDQIYLEKGEASLEDVLLQRKQLATDYEYYGSIGVSYTFGSIFNTVVNPRMG